jgi:hypothetical protein
MANNVTGKNIMLYNTMYNAKYYFNGGISKGTIDGNAYYQLGTSNNIGSAANFTTTGDDIIARFITDVNVPGVTNVIAGTWTFSSYVSITSNLTESPAFYYIIYKYDGTTYTSIGSSSAIPLTSTSSTLYTASISFAATTLSTIDRLVVWVYPQNVGSRNITFYTQASSLASVTTTLPYDMPFACSTNCVYSVQVGQKEVTSATSAWYKEFKNDIATWTISCDGLITLNNYGYLYLLQLQQSRASIFVKFVIDNGSLGLVIISGNCNMTSLQINAPWKEIGTYAVSLQGTGAYGLTGTTINSNGALIIGGSVVNKQYTAAGGETTITWADMIGKVCLYVSRGGIDVREIVAGTPTGEQVSWNSISGVLTFARVLESDEFIRMLAQ